MFPRIPFSCHVFLITFLLFIIIVSSTNATTRQQQQRSIMYSKLHQNQATCFAYEVPRVGREFVASKIRPTSIIIEFIITGVFPGTCDIFLSIRNPQGQIPASSSSNNFYDRKVDQFIGTAAHVGIPIPSPPESYLDDPNAGDWEFCFTYRSKHPELSSSLSSSSPKIEIDIQGLSTQDDQIVRSFKNSRKEEMSKQQQNPFLLESEKDGSEDDSEWFLMSSASVHRDQSVNPEFYDYLINRDLAPVLEKAEQMMEYHDLRAGEFEKTAASSYFRIIWFTISEVVIAVCVVVWQVWTMKKLFKEKKVA